VRQALVGNVREEHIVALTQALELYDVYQAKVAACDKQIEAILKRLKKSAPPPADKLPPVRQRARQPNAPAKDRRQSRCWSDGTPSTRAPRSPMAQSGPLLDCPQRRGIALDHRRVPRDVKHSS
jgi:hypothetical protein